MEVLREGRWQTVDSSELVLRDVIRVADGMVLPCDAVLVQGGTCLVDEAMLTGEAVPVLKTALPVGQAGEESAVTLTRPSAQLFAGTRVMHTGAADLGTPPVALVHKVGIFTAKGELVHSIMYPRTPAFSFVQQSYKFIALLFGVALLGFGLSVWRLEEVNASKRLVVLRAFDLITIVVPPSLPLAMTVGTNFALRKLKRHDIFCTSPSRINMAGLVKLVCFDKTGTLTEDRLQVVGVLCCPEGDGNSTRLPVAMHRAAGGVTSRKATETLAVCHHLANVDGQLLGDPLEVAALQFVGATLGPRGSDEINYPPGCDAADRQFEVLARFAFVAELQRMCVVARDRATGQAHAFVKGASEVVVPRCASKPANLDSELDRQVRAGFRVLALASRALTPDELDRVQQWATHAQGGEQEERALRDVLEATLHFRGLLVLENTLKPESVPTLDVLRAADIQVKMVTGDNALTAMAVARHCGILHAGFEVWISEPSSAGDDEGGIRWVHADKGAAESLSSSQVLQRGRGWTAERPCQLVLTGVCFAALLRLRPAWLYSLLTTAQVFARFTPDQKGDLVTLLQHGGDIFVGMVGDGANDCPALKAAHVGVSVAAASEASIAAPFTSRQAHIACVPRLLAEGRASLVTSFQLFRFMAMYSLIQFTAAILCYFKGGVLGNYQYLYQVGGGNLKEKRNKRRRRK